MSRKPYIGTEANGQQLDVLIYCRGVKTGLNDADDFFAKDFLWNFL
ncbi:hypothetical protein [Agriterribacter sp.]|nr:hypothetical protein [Agriterribacter sp.]HRP54450.1 hypothetical protein [Agriterribacter sp.]